MKSLVDIIEQHREDKIVATQTEVKTETLEYMRREIRETVDRDFELEAEV